MPIVVCPTCWQRALVLKSLPNERTCSGCGQVFWIQEDPDRAREGIERPVARRVGLPEQGIAPDRRPRRSR